MSLVTSLNHNLSVVHTISRGLANPQSSVRKSVTSSLQDGTGNDQADLLLHSKDTIAAGTSKSYDLRGSLTDDFGNTVTMAKLRAVNIENTSTDPSSVVTIKPAATNGVSFLGSGGEVTLGPGGMLMLWWPKDSAPSITDTSDTLVIEAASGATVDPTVEVVFVGTSA